MASSTTPVPESPSSGAGGCLLRLLWMLGGNAALLLTAVGIGQRRHPVGVMTALYWGVVALILAARYVDIRHCHGQTARGTPATLKDWRSHALLLVVLAAVLWLMVYYAPRWLGR